MSEETASVESDAEDSVATSVLDLWRRWYDMVALAGLMVFMLFVRLQSWGRFVRGDQVLFSGNDAYYHSREIAYAVDNWPWTMPFDPWTAFPYGTSQGQFGTLYDQLVATGALIVGLGNPSPQQVELVTLAAPAVFGALVAIPVYYIARRLHNRATGVFAVLLLALMPGTFLRRSSVGFADHHVAEVLFISIAVFATMVALRVAETELPVYEQLLDRDWEGLKRPVTYSALAGVGVSLYMWVWPPGVVLVGILGIFYTISLVSDYVGGRSPDHVAQVGIVSMAVVVVLMLLQIQSVNFSTTRASLLQPALALGVLVWCVFLAGLARVWDERDVAAGGYPGAIVGVLLIGFAFLAVVLPRFFGLLVNNALRAFGFGQSASTLTVSEAQPTPGIDPFNVGTLTQFLFQQYGFAFVIALFAMGGLIAKVYLSEYRSEHVLLFVWSVFAWLMALTQIRFHYYLVVPVVVLTAWGVSRVVSITGVPSVTQRLGDIKPYQVFAIFAIVILVFAPMLPPIASGANTPPFVMDAGKSRPSGANWADSADWMTANTPDLGMDYTATYDWTTDFDYPDSAYGVMAWWDYGHWITVLGERIPHANPFQQNARSASSFLQASSERRANLILDAIPSLNGRTGQIDQMSNAELQSVVANQTSQEATEDVRYVMIDDRTAMGKFTAVTRWSIPPKNRKLLRQSGLAVDGRNNTRLYLQRATVRFPSGNQSVPILGSRYMSSMTAKLYLQDANGLSHYRLVHENSRYSIVGGVIAGQRRPPGSVRLRDLGGWTQTLENTSLRLQFADRADRALQISQNILAYNASIESSLKVFERVPGATVTGRVKNASNATVVVRVKLRTGPGRTFDYLQETRTDASGRFEVTVPYATNDVVATGEGGTNSSVAAVGNYSVYVNIPRRLFENPRFSGRIGQLFPAATTFNLSEKLIYSGGAKELGTITTPGPSGNQSDGGSDGGNQSEGNTTDGNTTGGTGGDGTGGDDTSGNESGSLAPPAKPQIATARGR